MMPTLLRRSGRVLARGLGLAFGVLGALAWAACGSFFIVFCYRSAWISLPTMMVLIGLSVGFFTLAGLLWSRRFTCYAVPLLEVVFSDENNTAGTKVSMHEVIVAVALVVALIALALGAALKSTAAVCVGVIAFIIYASLAPRAFEKAKKE